MESFARLNQVERLCKKLPGLDCGSYEGNPFPEEVDKDGDGLVYYTIAGESNERSGFMDQETYDQWLDSVLEGAGEVKVPYVKLTTDNIYAIE